MFKLGFVRSVAAAALMLLATAAPAQVSNW